MSPAYGASVDSFDTSVPFDAQIPQFRVSSSPRVMELLRAIPKVRVRTARQGFASSDRPHFDILTPTGGVEPAGFYDATVETVVQTFECTGAPVHFASIGQRVQVLAVDAETVSPASAQNAQLRFDLATQASCVRLLGRAIARGADYGVSDHFDGLQDLIEEDDDARGSFGEAAADAIAAVAVNGPDGLGLGADCLIVNDAAFAQALQYPPHGSGWWHCPRAGVALFHYAGLPVYRADMADPEGGGGYVYAARLGRWGLQLAYAVGDESTCGFIWSAPEQDLANGLATKLYYGSFALVLWEPTAAAGVKFTLPA